jgi:hypothetical protein
MGISSHEAIRTGIRFSMIMKDLSPMQGQNPSRSWRRDRAAMLKALVVLT